jgi:Adenylate and Guanylate cyclase catalytic domain
MTDQEAKPKRRLAAIMATDVVGYSKLMQSDEAVALAALAAIRKATQEHIELHQGRIANTAGDSVLAEFGSAVEAVDCAMALQQQLSSRTEGEDLQVRIGIHLGDVVDKGGDLFGTAVNVPLDWRALRSLGQSWCRRWSGMRLASFHQWTREANVEARSCFYRAIELDPLFAWAMEWPLDVTLNVKPVGG